MCKNFFAKLMIVGIAFVMLFAVMNCSEGLLGSMDKLREEAIEENKPKDSTINAQKPEIIGQPAGINDSPGSSVTLTVTATIDDGGNLSYQWYKNSAKDYEGEAIEDATNNIYAPITTSNGTLYYYVAVTNTNNSVNGFKTATVFSDIVSVIITPIVNAETPEITVQPVSRNYNPGDAVMNLSVTAQVGDGGSLSYQWYRNTQNSSTLGSIDQVGTNNRLYSPDITAEGTLYYWVVVTYTNNSVNGNKTTTVTSSIVSITVDVLTHAAIPEITVQPQGRTYNQGESAVALSVTVTRSDTGTLSYQWYRNNQNSTAAGTPTPVGISSTTYTPVVSSVGTLYYWVVVTNTNNSVNGNKTATVTSNIVSITVEPIVDAATPVITSQPQGATIDLGQSTSPLSVTATRSDGGTLSYQWFRNTANNTSGGTSVQNGSSNTYQPVVSTAGTFYYWVVVTNTNNSVNGNKTATATSNIVAVTVNPIVNAQTPSITGQPQGKTYSIDDTVTNLSVTASVTDGGTLSYQWFRNTANSTSGGTSVQNSSSNIYTPNISAVSTYYYYVVVTNTNNSVNGTKIATVTSSVAAIIVKPKVTHYQAGSYRGSGFTDYACYWKDGDITILESSIQSIGFDIAVYDTDIFIVGRYLSDSKWIPCYWKNGVRADLVSSSSCSGTSISYMSSANVIAISGSNVYFGGVYYNTSNNPVAFCYSVSSGTKTDLSYPYGVPATSVHTAEVCSITVTGATVYLSGWYDNSGGQQPQACYWSSSATYATELVHDTAVYYIGSSSIALSGSIVYVAGTFEGGAWDGAVLWRNGTQIDLQNKERSYGRGIFISGSDVYIGGEYMDYQDGNFTPCYWKGTTTQTTQYTQTRYSALSGIETGYLSGIIVSDDNIYIMCNYQLSGIGSYHVGYFENGTIKSYEIGGRNTFTRATLVIKTQ